jgi:hypothetical protein
MNVANEGHTSWISSYLREILTHTYETVKSQLTPTDVQSV